VYGRLAASRLDTVATGLSTIQEKEYAMQHSKTLALVTGITLAASAPCGAEVVWGVDANVDALYTLDLVTGMATTVGPLHPDPDRYTTPVAMAVRPGDGMIFVNNNSPASDDGLSTVDPDTGLATFIGGSYIDGALAFDDADNLYAADSTGALATVDQANGDPTPLGGPSLPRLFGLDHNPVDGLLYGITGSASALDLLVIDPSNGALLDTRPLDTALGGSAAGTLLFDSSGTLHGTVNAASDNLYEIDPATGAVSNIRTADNSAQGLGIRGPAPSLDIKPGSCPNSFNRRSRGVLPVALVGDTDFDVLDVDVTTLALSRLDGVGGSVEPLNGPPGPGIEIADVASPFDGDVESCECHEVEGDGIDDISMKFRTQELVDVLMLGDRDPGELVPLVLSGQANGIDFTATDCIRLVPPSAMGLFIDANVPGAWIEVSPNDTYGDGGGFTPFIRDFEAPDDGPAGQSVFPEPFGQVVTLVAPQTYASWVFAGWRIGDMAVRAYEWHEGNVLQLRLTQQTRIEAVYEPTNAGGLQR
jgi:hypothetical protein